MLPHKFNVEVLYKLGVLEKRLNKHMDKTNEWIKHMKQIMVVKRRGQNEHLNQGVEQKQINILQQWILYWYIKNITNSTNKIIVCVYVWARVCVCVCVTQLSYKKNCKFQMSFFYG